MGFVLQRKTYKLIFADPALVGFEVKATAPPLGQFMELTRLADLAVPGPDEVTRLLTGFAEAVVTWNLETADGVAVPCTVEALHGMDADFVLGMIMAWIDAIASVPTPLDQRSTGGVPSLEASMPMDVVSPNPET